MLEKPGTPFLARPLRKKGGLFLGSKEGAKRGSLRLRTGRGRLNSLNGLLRVSCLRTVRQNFQVVLIFLPRLIRPLQLFQARRQPERRNRVVALVIERLSITILGAAKILAREVKVSHLNVFRRLVRIPRTKLAYIAIAARRSPLILQQIRALRM